MKRNKKQILSICYLLLVFIVTLVLAILLSKESKGSASVLQSLNPVWLLASLGCMIGYLFIESFAVWFITAFMYKKLGYAYIMKLDIIGNYYGALTPAAMGFQPSQIAYMKRDGIPVGVSTFIQTIKLMAYEVVILVICLVFMSFKGVYFYHNNPEIFWLSIFGALINIIVISAMVLAIAKYNILRKIVFFISGILAKIKVVKHLDRLRMTISKSLDEFRDSAKYLKEYKSKVAFACLLTLFQWLLFFTIPYCLYNAFGFGMLNGNSGAFGTVSALDEFVTIVAMAAFLFLAVHFIPIPGSSGATEAGFGIFFGSFFMAGSAAAMFIWRLITYYSLIILGFIVIFFDGLKRKKAASENGIGEDLPPDKTNRPPEPKNNSRKTDH